MPMTALIKANSIGNEPLLPHIQNRISGGSNVNITSNNESLILSLVCDVNLVVGDPVTINSSDDNVSKATINCVGICSEVANSGSVAKIIIKGKFTNSSSLWADNVGSEIFLINGSLVAKPFPNSTTVANYQSVGIILSANTLFIDIKTAQIVSR